MGPLSRSFLYMGHLNRALSVGALSRAVLSIGSISIGDVSAGALCIADLFMGSFSIGVLSTGALSIGALSIGARSIRGPPHRSVRCSHANMGTDKSGGVLYPLLRRIQDPDP